MLSRRSVYDKGRVIANIFVLNGRIIHPTTYLIFQNFGFMTFRQSVLCILQISEIIRVKLYPNPYLLTDVFLRPDKSTGIINYYCPLKIF